MATVAIFRCVLLPASETFIRNQGTALTRWRPAFAGAIKDTSFNSAPNDHIAFAGHGLGYFLLRLTGRSSALRQRLAETKPAVLHAHFGGDGWLVSHTARRLGIPLVITLHGYDVTSQPVAPGLRGWRHRRHLRQAFGRADLIIAVSDFIRRRAIDLGADATKVRVHHTGVAIPAASPSPAPAEWDIAFVGRFVEKKGIDDLVEAAGLLSDIRPRMVFIGGGPLEPEIRARAAALDLDATFLGVQEPSAVRQHMVASRVFVSPSKTAPNGDTEGLPTTILEAASLGVPAVSTHHSGIPEAVLDGETGLLSAEGDRAALADNIRRLLTDDGLRTRLGRAARTHVEAHFDLAKQTLLLEDLYDTVARDTADRPGNRSA
jgi:glycosyltransferase involved in cell wall biosynthesis